MHKALKIAQSSALAPHLPHSPADLAVCITLATSSGKLKIFQTFSSSKPQTSPQEGEQDEVPTPLPALKPETI